MTRALCDAAPTRLLVTIMYLVLLTFNFNLLNFNHFVKLARSSFIFSKQSAKFSPAIERIRVSSANRLFLSVKKLKISPKTEFGLQN
jgi:hypothetical protein